MKFDPRRFVNDEDGTVWGPEDRVALADHDDVLTQILLAKGVGL